MQTNARAKGYSRVAGIDEAGRGPLAGPVVAACCLLKSPQVFPGINDSKLLTPLKRQKLFDQLITHPQVEYAVGIVDAAVIDEINILQATLLAMRKSVLALPKLPDYLLVDGNVALVFEKIFVENVIKGDQRSQLIAAASIIAKQTRDQIMIDYHFQYPMYGFDAHKGYGTKKHMQALEKYGPSPIHRKTFSPGF